MRNPDTHNFGEETSEDQMPQLRKKGNVELNLPANVYITLSKLMHQGADCMNKRREAEFWDSLENDQVRCGLCPHNCRIVPGKHGVCGIRRNVDGKLIAEAYGIYPAIHRDPIEKKPLYHFIPGSTILSVGSVGCNLNCSFCQNWSLSREDTDGKEAYFTPPEALIEGAGSKGSIGIAFTYNEPTINYEYIMDVIPSLKKNGLRSVLVTNGFLSGEPWDNLMEYIDGANIDVKAFSDKFYREITKSRLDPVLDNVKSSFDKGVHIELTYLVIPGYNDSGEEIDRYLDWVTGSLSTEIPLHFTRFHPDYMMSHVEPTPIKTLDRIMDQCREKGITHAYVGNVAFGDFTDTRCGKCGEVLIKRSGFSVRTKNMDGNRCRKCGKTLYGVFD
jgi:pyruvate formate lyase activating enzyme